MDFKRNIIITGGAGFIGSHVVRLFVNQYPDYHIINLDKLTYAGNLANLKDIEDRPNYTFVKADICDFDKMSELIRQYRVDGIIHLAAESHVDRSIKDPFTFARTNVMGTLSLLQAAKEYWESLPEGYEGKRFYHISTDEVYGALELTHPEGIEPPFTTTASSSEHHLAYGEAFFLENTLHIIGKEQLIPAHRHGAGPHQFYVILNIAGHRLPPLSSGGGTVSVLRSSSRTQPFPNPPPQGLPLLAATRCGGLLHSRSPQHSRQGCLWGVFLCLPLPDLP